MHMSKTALMFAGQGAQVVGMGKDLAEAFPNARQWFDRDGVDAIFDVINSGTALAVNSLAKEKKRLAFVTAMGAMAGNLGAQAMGRERMLDYLKVVAETSAALENAEDLDRFFPDDEPDS